MEKSEATSFMDSSLWLFLSSPSMDTPGKNEATMPSGVHGATLACSGWWHQHYIKSNVTNIKLARMVLAVVTDALIH